jgi:RNA polymerase sigma-70 factor (ECF subfamily)
VARGARSPESEEEAALVRAATAGRTESFAELVRRYEGPLLRFLELRCTSREDAEELCQESFLRAWRQLDRYDARWRFSTWLFTLARRLAISAGRRAAPRALAGEQVDQVDLQQGPAEQAALRERSEGLWALSERLLSADQRAALWLRYAENHSAEEIGRVLGRRPAAVRVLLFRARTVLAEHLDPSLAEGLPGGEERATFFPALRARQAVEGGS